MKLILFLAAIYALIIHQSRKNALETELPAKKKTMMQKKINLQPPLSVKLYPQQFALRKDSIQRLGFGGSMNTGNHTKRNEKGQPFISLLTNPFFISRQ